MAQGRMEYDKVKGRIGERNGSTVSCVERQLWKAPSELSRLLYKNRRWVDSDHVFESWHFGKDS
jgi:hypothetical protein